MRRIKSQETVPTGQRRVSSKPRPVQPTPPAPPVPQPDRSGMRLEHVTPDSLVEWDGNPRDNDEAARELAATIAEHGFIDPIIATRDDRMVRAGHTRLKAAKINGMDLVPVIFVDFVSEAMAQAYSLADNRLGEKAAWNQEKLADLFGGELETIDVGAVEAATGFVQPEIEGLRIGYVEPDAPEEFPEVGDDIKTEHRCPRCGYEWSGKSV